MFMYELVVTACLLSVGIQHIIRCADPNDRYCKGIETLAIGNILEIWLPDSLNCFETDQGLFYIVAKCIL